jgi:hypothetical protein
MVSLSALVRSGHLRRKNRCPLGVRSGQIALGDCPYSDFPTAQNRMYIALYETNNVQIYFAAAGFHTAGIRFAAAG